MNPYSWLARPFIVWRNCCVSNAHGHPKHPPGLDGLVGNGRGGNPLCSFVCSVQNALGLWIVIPVSSEHLMEALNDKLRFFPHVQHAADLQKGAAKSSDAGHLGAFRFKFTQTGKEISIFCFDWPWRWGRPRHKVHVKNDDEWAQQLLGTKDKVFQGVFKALLSS